MLKWLLVLFLVMFGCDDEETKETVVEQNDSPTATLATGALQIGGQLANKVDANNTDVLNEQEVKIVRNDGFVVGKTTTKDDGSFAFDIPAGGLVLDSAFSLALAEDDQTESNAATSDDFTYELRAEVPDDGAGKALGVRQKLDLSVNAFDGANEGELNVGEAGLKEVTAIVGSVKFEDTTVSASGTDVYIPGQSFFLRTGEDGKFGLLFVPVGKYIIRLEKSPFRKDVEVDVQPGQTLNLSVITIKQNERNPLPLAEAIKGTWNVTCYFKDAGSVTPENPTTGTVIINALDDVTVTGESCLMRTMTAALRPFSNFILLGDGGLIGKHDDGGGTDYYTHQVTNYSNSRMVISVDPIGFTSTRVIEVFERQ